MKHMKSLGVETLHLRDLEKNQPFKDEELNFEGFQIAETDLAESSDDDCDWEDGNDRKVINRDSSFYAVIFLYLEVLILVGLFYHSCISALF